MKLPSWLRRSRPHHHIVTTRNEFPPAPTDLSAVQCDRCQAVGNWWEDALGGISCRLCGSLRGTSLEDQLREVTAERDRLQSYLDNARVMKTLPEDALPAPTRPVVRQVGSTLSISGFCGKGPLVLEATPTGNGVLHHLRHEDHRIPISGWPIDAAEEAVIRRRIERDHAEQAAEEVIDV